MSKSSQFLNYYRKFEVIQITSYKIIVIRHISPNITQNNNEDLFFVYIINISTGVA